MPPLKFPAGNGRRRSEVINKPAKNSQDNGESVEADPFQWNLRSKIPEVKTVGE